jgi:radical SAM protein with 4Fe4S-binding SPASM domain
VVTINIEPTDFCNAKCYYCIIGTERQPHPHPRGFMSMEIHNKLFQDLDTFMNDFSCAPTFDKSVYLRYCGVGEPTLHPDFIAMFDKGLNYPAVNQVAVLSNGSLWGKEMVDEFIKASLSQPNKPIELIFSLDTLNSQTQSKIKSLTNINTIIVQLIYLLEQKVQNHLNNVHLILQMIILQDNFSETKKFCHFWTKALNDRGLSVKIVYAPDYAKYFLEKDCFIWFKQCDSDSVLQQKYLDLHREVLRQVGIAYLETENSCYSIETGSTSRVAYFNQQDSKVAYICSMLWYGITVFANGDISPCCSDVNLELKIGNLLTNSLNEIYRSKAMRDLRNAHIHNNLIDYPICKDCPILYRGTLVCNEDIIQYLNILAQETT